MPKKTVLADRNYEIAYDDKTQKFYLDDKNHDTGSLIDNWVEIPHTPPFNIEVGDKEVVVFSTMGKATLGCREKKGKEWAYEIYEDNSLKQTNKNALPKNIFSWHDQRQQMFILSEEGRRVVKTKLAPTQKTQLDATLFGEAAGPFSELKKTCTSGEEYANCLRYLLGIENQQRPKVALITTDEAITGILDNYFNPQAFKKFPLNNKYEGHMATLSEARKYIHKVFQKELEGVDSDTVAPELHLDPASWDYLFSPGEDDAALRKNKLKPTYEQPLAAQAHIKKVIQAIEAVYEFGSDPIILKGGLDLPALQISAKYLSELLSSDYQSDLANLARPFLIRMFKGTESFNALKSDFLLPLYQAIIQQIHRNSLNLNQPRAEQFQAFRVDEWNGVRRWATHADFVNEQFKNPQAVFVIPDNFDDAKLPDNERHKRQGRAGLAEPMAPVKVAQNPDGSPIYDLCTVGIPTGGKFSDNTEAAKQKIKQYFAGLYTQVKQGRTIVVPYTNRSGELIPAFGTGTFADSALTAELRPFIFAEFNKLKNFCNGTLNTHQLDEEYRKAWEQAAVLAALPLPQITMPVEPAGPPAILGKDLLNPGLRANFKEWFLERNLGKLTEHIDEKSKTRTLTGTLSTGAQITIHNDRIELNGADKMDDKAFEDSMREVIRLYIDGYAPGEPPPTKVLGSDKQKAMIFQLLREAKIEVVADKSPAGDAPESPPPSPDDSVPSTSQLRHL